MKRTISYLLFSLCCVIAFGASAAERKITGVVIAGDYKEPLIGASVFVSSENLKKAGSSQTSLGVITDMDGKFTINVPEGVTSLQCSYVGYESQTIHLAAGKNSYEVVLQPSAHMLDAVVVTGYQTIERRKLTAAVTKLDITDDKIGSVMSIDQALSGQVAGLSSIASSGAPGAAPKIRIRGTASLNGTQDPLWVLDGGADDRNGDSDYGRLERYRQHLSVGYCRFESCRYREYHCFERCCCYGYLWSACGQMV